MQALVYHYNKPLLFSDLFIRHALDASYPEQRDVTLVYEKVGDK